MPFVESSWRTAYVQFPSEPLQLSLLLPCIRLLLRLLLRLRLRLRIRVVRIRGNDVGRRGGAEVDGGDVGHPYLGGDGVLPYSDPTLSTRLENRLFLE